MNTVCLTGRLTAAVELRYTTTQKPVASFTLAVEREYKNGDERLSDFISCVAWNQSAVFLEKYAGKGSRVGVSGRIQTRRWKDRDGNNRYSTEVICDSVEVLDYKKRDSEDAEPKRERRTRTEQDSESGSGYEVYTPPGMEELPDSGDLPF